MVSFRQLFKNYTDMKNKNNRIPPTKAKKKTPPRSGTQIMSDQDLHNLNKELYEDMRVFDLEATFKEQNSLIEAGRTFVGC